MTLEVLYDIGDILGLSRSAEDLGIREMAARAIYGYILLVGIVRIGHTRLLAGITPFDIVLGILLGSIASRAITGNAPYYPAIGACAVLVAMHALFAAIAFRSKAFSFLVKGRAKPIVRDGEPDPRMLRRTHTAGHDVAEALRLHGVTKMEDVAEAHLERNGEISVVRKTRQP
jgi:uncharacterized membrane protein YcaP (DUF421 family)